MGVILFTGILLYVYSTCNFDDISLSAEIRSVEPNERRPPPQAFDCHTESLLSSTDPSIGVDRFDADR